MLMFTLKIQKKCQIIFIFLDLAFVERSPAILIMENLTILQAKTRFVEDFSNLNDFLF